MRIAAISDIYGDLPNIDPTDLLLVCGAWSLLHIQCNFWSMCTWLREVFISYLSSLIGSTLFPCNECVNYPPSKGSGLVTDP